MRIIITRGARGVPRSAAGAIKMQLLLRTDLKFRILHKLIFFQHLSQATTIYSRFFLSRKISLGSHLIFKHRPP